MQITEYIDVPTNKPASCAFVGENMDTLVITTASLGLDVTKDKNAGFVFIKQMNIKGRKPFLFG